jgi:hypothetical protein
MASRVRKVFGNLFKRKRKAKSDASIYPMF